MKLKTAIDLIYHEVLQLRFIAKLEETTIIDIEKLNIGAGNPGNYNILRLVLLEMGFDEEYILSDIVLMNYYKLWSHSEDIRKEDILEFIESL